MRKNRIYAGMLAAALVAEAVVCTGCGENTQESVPALIEPKAANAAYRPVELGDIGKTEVLYATVVPADYCSFFDTYANVAEITVEVGDYVEEGEIVAYADVAAAKGELEELNAELLNENQNYDLNCKMAQVRIQQLEALTEEEAAKATQIATEQENLRYDGLLYEYRVKKIKEEIAVQQELVTDGTLKASHSGYVTYTKNVGESTLASAGENIVVVSDPGETYLELPKTIDKYAYEDYEVKYLMLAGKRYDVTELPYSMEAVVLAKASDTYPNVRLVCNGETELTLSETYPVFYRKNKLEDVPIIGLDSLNGEKDNYYVYVKNEAGEREKRAVTIGEKDENYVQVQSGLEVGDLVYYESEARMPGNYEEYTVELSDYKIENLSRSYQLADEQIYWYDADCEGTIAEIAVKKKDEVEAGDLLFVIDSEAGKAALAEAENNINRENTTYTRTIKTLDESLAAETDENARCLLSYQKELETINHTYRLGKLEKEYGKMVKNNDGTGKISVYAKQSGTVSKLEVEKGAYVGADSHILSLVKEAEDKLLVQMAPLKDEKYYEKNIAGFGEAVTITADEKVYEGTCIGMTVNQQDTPSKNYVTINEEGAALSYCGDSGYSHSAFYVEMEDETFYRDMPKGKVSFSYVAMQDVVVIPTALVQEETRLNAASQKYYFVWRVVGEELVKQYVLINEEFSDLNQTVILSGLEAGDVLAKSK